jgi:hypothetical protein
MTIFLSYAHEDIGTVEALVRDLEELGDPVWFDKSIAGGQEWWDEILRQIRECRLFVLAVSKFSLSSEACISEWDYAAAVARPQLTMRLEQADMVSAPAAIKRHQYIDYVANDVDTVRRLAKTLRLVPAATPLPPTLPPDPPVPPSYRERFAFLYGKELSVSSQVEAFALLKLDIDNDYNAAEALRLIGVLRGRFDTSWKVCEDIDRYLAERESATVKTEPKVQAAATLSAPQQPLPAAAWYADPTRRFELRYWDGTRWTEHVGRGGVVSTDPFLS